ncbi:MAG: RND family transporter [bacterium]|nr:RND family transporter [bacterium]
MRKYADFIINNPKKIILIAVLISIVLATGIRKIQFNENIKSFLPTDMPSRLTLNELEEIFGGSDVALIGIGNEDESIFNVGTLQKIKAITDSLEVMDGINRVTSLATIKYMKGHDWGLEVIPYLEVDPETEEDARRIREMFFEDSTYAGILVSEDGNYTSVMAQVTEEADVKAVYQEIKKLTDEIEGPEIIYMAGTPIITTIISKNMKEDLRRLIPFVILLIIILLFASFRSLIGVLLPLGAVILSLLSMLGLMGHLGFEFTTFNNIMPIILLGIGIDYGIHIMTNFYQEAELLNDKKSAIKEAITHISIPMLMACVTTMAGFMSLLTSPLTMHHELAYLISFGIFMAMAYNMTFVPAFLSLLPMPKTIKKRSKNGLINRFLALIGKSVVKFRHGFAVLGILIAVVAAFGIPKVEIEMNPITFFPESSEVVQADNMVNENLSGSVNMNILFEGDIQSEYVMNSMSDLQDFIEQYDEVGSTMSLATVVKKINKALNENDPEYDRIPETNAAVAQALLMYESSGEPDDFESIVDNTYQYGQVIAMLKSVATKKVAGISNEIDAYIEENIKELTVKTTGFSVFFKDLAYLVIQSQARSISFAVVVVFLIAFATYRRFILGFLSIIPLAMCVILNFGIMGYAGIDLNIPMAMISSMIIGIGVDFSFHFISRFRIEMKESKDSMKAALTSIKRVGEPILYSALTTACGGLVLTISGFIPVRYLGFMLAVIMTFCAILALTLLASSLTYIKNNKV